MYHWEYARMCRVKGISWRRFRRKTDDNRDEVFGTDGTGIVVTA